MHAAACSHAEPPRDATPPARPPCCPVCNGQRVPLRGAYRCSRCMFILCVGCEAAEAATPAVGE